MMQFASNKVSVEEERQKRILITGANQGIGLATAIQLARQGGYTIYLACRSEARAIEAVAKIESASPGVQVHYLMVDFSSIKSVQLLIEQIYADNLLFDAVVLNAGVLLPKERITKDGFETTFQVNYLGQYQLINAIVQNQTTQRRMLKVVTVSTKIYIFLVNIICLIHQFSAHLSAVSPLWSNLQCKAKPRQMVFNVQLPQETMESICNEQTCNGYACCIA